MISRRDGPTRNQPLESKKSRRGGGSPGVITFRKKGKKSSRATEKPQGRIWLKVLRKPFVRGKGKAAFQ